MVTRNKILSVDDSSIVRKIIRNAVEAMEYELLEAYDGKEALSILETNYNDIALILLDWNMPGMGGFDFLKAVKSHFLFKSIPVMMITTESEKDSIIKAVQAGISNYLLKPFKNEELTRKIMETLGRGGVR